MKKAVLWTAVLATAWLAAGSPSRTGAENAPTGFGDDGRAYYDFGVFAYEDGEYEEAADHFRMALEFDPDNLFFHHYLGRTFLKRGRIGDAEIHLERAMALNPDIPGLVFDVAMLRHRQGDDIRAAALFEQAAADSDDDVLARYYAGISLFRLERYEAAARHFTEAAEKSPEARARGLYYAGVSYRKAGDPDRALPLFERVMADPDAGEFAALARQWAAAIEEGDSGGKPWRIFAKLGRVYDDNVALDIDDLDPLSETSDGATHFFFSGRYEFLRLGSFRMGAGYRHYWMDYDDLNAYDFTGSLGEIYTAYRFAPFTVRMVYAPAYYWIDGDSYLRRHQLGPDLLWQASPRLLTRLSYRYADNRYFGNDDRSGHDNTVFSEAYLDFPDAGVRLLGRLEYEGRNARAADREYGQFGIGLDASMELPWKLRAGVSGDYRARSYDAVDRFYGVEREDDRYALGLRLSRPLFREWLGILGEYRHIRNDSNISDYEYTRNQFTLSVTATY